MLNLRWYDGTLKGVMMVHLKAVWWYT